MIETRRRILDVALEVLGRDPDAGMGEIASAAGVVRRTVYGYFPARADLVRTLAQEAVDDLADAAAGAADPALAADQAWVDFVGRLWPFAQKYRVAVALRRGEYGAELHSLLGPVDGLLTDLVERGQRTDVFGRHLPATLLSQLAYGAVFTIAEQATSSEGSGAAAAALTSLLMLGVGESRAAELVSRAGLT